jgi:hypothetical protein
MRRTWLVLVAAISFSCAGLPAAAAAVPSAEDLADLESRIEYAYYAGEARALTTLAEEAAALLASDLPWAPYQAAHLDFRLARLARDRGDGAAAVAAAQRCRQRLEVANGLPDPLEGRLLAAICAAYAGGGNRALGRRVGELGALNPQNPRLLLARAYLAEDGGRALAPSRALEAARAAAAAFRRPVAAAPGAPTWGAPDAWLLVGTRAEAVGEWLTAREAYEQCLVLAPDYARARARLAALNERAR